jgi:hypothetical protein
MDYKHKYIKYKNKYLELKNIITGGLINNISSENLLKQKLNYTIPTKLKKYKELITIPDTNVIQVGSSINKIQPYFSDIDLMNIIKKNMSKNELIKFFINNIKKIINNIQKDNTIFFSDFKAGGLHWKINEILNEKKDNITLYDACNTINVIKLDIIIPYDERYIEMTSFYILETNEELINVDKNYYKSIKKSLLNDINEFKKKKPFKAIKRLWSLAKIENNFNVLNKLKDIIRSSISLLAQINADIETIILLVLNNNNYDLNFLINELDSFKEKISYIIDIKIDEEKTTLIINYLINLFKSKEKTEENKNEILNNLNLFHDYLLEIINKETIEYLENINK